MHVIKRPIRTQYMSADERMVVDESPSNVLIDGVKLDRVGAIFRDFDGYFAIRT